MALLLGKNLWIETFKDLLTIGRTETEAPMVWPTDAKSRLIEKYLDFGKDWEQEEKRATENEMVRWPHWLSEHEFEQTLGDSEGQGSLTFYSLWGYKESDTTWWLNSNNHKKVIL